MSRILDEKKSTLQSVHNTGSDCVGLLNHSTAHLPGTSFVADHTLLPSHRHVLDAANTNKLEMLYWQFYPHLDMVSLSPFYFPAGHGTCTCMLCGDIQGSVLNATNCQSSSTITNI